MSKEKRPKINITPYVENFYSLTYREKIRYLEGYIFSSPEPKAHKVSL